MPPVRCRGEDAVVKAPHSASASHPLRGRWRRPVGFPELARAYIRPREGRRVMANFWEDRLLRRRRLNFDVYGRTWQD